MRRNHVARGARRKEKKWCFGLMRIVSCMLTGAFLLGVPFTGTNRAYQMIAYADKTAEEQKREEAQNALENTNQQIENITGEKQEVEGDILDAESKLKVLLNNTKVLKEEIGQKQLEVDKTNEELEEAKRVQTEQYAQMKLRIQYMYENQVGDSFLSALLESDGLSDMLNRLEYVARVYKSDRELMNRYEQAVVMVQEKTQLLAQELDELLAKQEVFLAQQAEMEELIAELEDKKADYANQLAQAKEQAKQYQKTIEKQNEIIAKLLEEEQKRKAAEEKRRKEEEERKRKEEEEKRRKQEEENKKQEQTNSDSSNSDSNEQDAPVSNSGVTGQDIVDYARQFVGNPYVWGGNSLTKGCDCSGFVHLVYEHFGISTPRYSQSFASVGVAVKESEMQPGDIIVYPPGSNGIGHVAIYIGNGCIVEAQSSKAGITDDRAYNRRTIKAIRRLI